MHSIHSLPTRTDLHDPMQLQQQQMQHQNEPQDQNTMTVLESLDPLQQQQLGEQHQIMGLIDPVQQQQQHLVQHLVQPAGHQQQQPHLHQLQPSLTSTSMDSTNSQIGSDEQQQQQQQQQLQHHGSARPANNNLLRQRPQIEGLVADAGGPIVKWLVDNYEIAEGESLPRSTVYNHYLTHCRQLQMASVNAASFGKLIRSVFIGLKTRRLGTRGHSKYHYFGIRGKQHIQHELQQQESAGCSRDLTNNENSNQNSDNGSESDSTGNGLECGRLSSSSSGKRVKRSSGSLPTRRSRMYEQQELGHHEQQGTQVELDTNGVYYSAENGTNGYNAGPGSNKSVNNNNNNIEHVISMEQTHCELADFRNHLGANWATLVDENWPQREPCLLERQLVKATSLGELAGTLVVFEANYRSYYKRMVELLSELKFLEVEQLWQEFWNPPDEKQWSVQAQSLDNGTNQHNQLHQQQQQQQQNGEQQSTSDIIHQHIEYQQQQHRHHQHQRQQIALTSHHLYQLTSQPIIINLINQIDHNLYAAIESFLLPDMLSPIPRPLAQQIRLFAKNIGPWIELAVKNYEPQFASEKSKTARAFGYALRRYTSLNHLSTASRAIWEKRSSLAQMSVDLSRVDLRDIEHQVSLMSHNNSESSVLLNTAPLTSATNNNPTGNNNELSCTDSKNNLIDHHHHPHHLCAMQPGQLIQNFLHLLEDPYPANSWPDWCRNLVESRVCGLSLEEARNFVLKWNFYISLIMKELTLRSAPSFGSFQLIRLLFDEYIFYLVVTRLAQAQHKTPNQLLSL